MDLWVKQQQATIEGLIDNQGIMEKNPKIMTNMMVNHLSQIIEEEGSPQIEQSKVQVLAMIQEKVSLATIASIEAPFIKEEFW